MELPPFPLKPAWTIPSPDGRTSGISAMDAYLLLTTPRFHIGVAGGGTT
jgi:hypothetical protein